MKHLLLVTFLFVCTCVNAQADTLREISETEIRNGLFDTAVYNNIEQYYKGKSIVFNWQHESESDTPSIVAGKAYYCVGLSKPHLVKTSYLTPIGYLYLKFLSSDSSLIYVDLLSVNNRSCYTKSRADKLKAKYGATTWNRILYSRVAIGMSKETCRLSWGEPEDINRTTTQSSVTEQWVYGSGSYLYFTNGVLTTIQN